MIVGSKNFTEQVVLGELLAQALERGTGLTVERRLNLGGTAIAHEALLSDGIDVYVEYTGTSLTAIFNEPPASDPDQVFARVRERYAALGLTAPAAARLQQHVRDARAGGRRAAARTEDD